MASYSLVFSITCFNLHFLLVLRNPADDKLKNSRLYKSPDGKEVYVTGTNLNGWIVEKTLPSNVEKNFPCSFRASRKNNPQVKVAPSDIEALRVLKYDEC